MRYNKYDSSVKNMIIQSNNPRLFPELKIPRTTALYWIKQSRDTGIVQRPGVFQDEVDSLKKEVLELKAKTYILKSMLDLNNLSVEWHGLRGIERKKKIVNLVEEMKDLKNHNHVIETLGISKSTFYRYRAEVLGCTIYDKKCVAIRANQLSYEDQRKMIDLALSPRLAHLSLKRLMYHAQREKIIFCGIDSWYKYLKLNRINRPLFRKRAKKKYGIGIRAKCPNELWHIDITQVKDKTGRKIYLQVVVDNYSRLVVDWKVSSLKDLKLSLRTLSSALRGNKMKPEFVLSDGGKENDNFKVKKVLVGRGIVQLIAKSSVSYSNSMIEAVFKQMKRDPAIRLPRSLKSFKQTISLFVQSYNHKYPHSSLGGATPSEFMMGDWNFEEFQKKLSFFRKEKVREQGAKNKTCRGCIRS